MPSSIAASLKENFNKRGAAFILCGGANTLFGYFGSIGLYEVLKNTVDLAIIIVLTRILTISFSFWTYKLFVFKTKDNWLKEYFRCYVTYGFSCIVVMGILYALVEFFGISFWFAQIVGTSIGVVLNFVGHNCFTFSSPPKIASREKM